MIGVVLAGGASTRFDGQPKGLALLDGRAMALRVADILAVVCNRVVIEAPRDAGYETFGMRLLHAAPEHAGKGPLAALATGLAAARPNEFVAFAPCDMPLLTPDVFHALEKRGGTGAYARTSLGVEPLVAVLNARMRAGLLSALAQQALPRTHAALDAAGAQPVDFADAAPFANVNTPDDLSRAESILRAQRQ